MSTLRHQIDFPDHPNAHDSIEYQQCDNCGQDTDVEELVELQIPLTGQVCITCLEEQKHGME